MNEITNPLMGGVLIGLASTLMLAGLGRITGISGIVAWTLSFSKPAASELWRYSFLLGLLLGGAFMYRTFPHYFAFEIESTYPRLIIAGLLVGYGTRLGSGCTSGHGVCGLGRMSRRSLVATLTFISFGMITVLVERVLL